MKFNWGIKILVVYSVFVLSMLGLVYMCTRQHFDLVSSDYYAQELKYQAVIDGSTNTRQLAEPILISQSGNTIDVIMPGSLQHIENGSIYFYRPSDASKDLTLKFNGKTFSINKSQFSNGLYKVKLSWTSAGKHYFDEQSLYIVKTK